MRRTSVLALAVLLLLIGFAVAAASTKAKVTVIGDSVADRMERNPAAIAALNDQFKLDLETRGCRRLVSRSCTIQGSSGPPPTVLQLVRNLSQNIGKIVVVDVGYNDTPSHYNHDLDTVMRALKSLGVKTVVWLTLRDPHHVYQASNADIRREPKEWPGFVIADWDSYSDHHPEWFAADGIHLTPFGAAKLGEFIHSVLLRRVLHRP
jgi:hypothetical protein